MSEHGRPPTAEGTGGPHSEGARGRAVLAADLRLDGEGGVFHRELPAAWTFGDDRVFGGYLAGLAMTAICAVVPQRVFLSSHVLFIGAARPGPVRVRAEVARSGANFSVARAELSQAGRPVLSCDAWLGEAGLSGGAPDAVPGWREPVPEGPSMDWLARLWPFMGVFEERGTDYPGAPQEFGGGPAHVELWSRPRQPLGSATVGQIFDVMAFDAHLMDSALRVLGMTAADALSLDLAVMWHSWAGRADWRRLRCSATLDGFVAGTEGRMWAGGALRATGLQQVRVPALLARRHPQPRAGG